ncbi:MAG: hypothetical protein M1461_08560 [Nitrospirae bacterium]|nr:hypothetical protein [Nitrospirota bacterium]
MKLLKDILADAKDILLAPVTNVLCVAGVALIGISFLDYDKTNGLTLHGQIHVGPAIAGLILMFAGALLFYRTNGCRSKNGLLDYNKGVEIQRGDLTIRIQIGEIQSIAAATRNSVIVLPANTTFIDDCATDKRTAMGAFFLDRFPDKVAALPDLFSKILAVNGSHPDEDGQFTAGTTIILPDDFAKPAKVVVTASTIRMAGSGITSSPQVICSCVEGILKCTADQRIDTIYLPILGSGHGGVDRGMALLFLLFAVLHFARAYHHIRLVQIIVHPKDVDSLNQSKEISQIVAL